VNLIPPFVIPNKLIELWLALRAKKVHNDFERVVRRLSHYAVHHGARATCLRLFISLRVFMLSRKRKKVFIKKCHEGFNIVQNEIAKLLPEVESELPQLRRLYREEIRRYKKDRKPPVPRYSKIGKAYSEQLFKGMVLREIANSIVWQILDNDGTKVRALIQGV